VSSYNLVRNDILIKYPERLWKMTMLL